MIKRTLNMPYHEFNYPQMIYKDMTDDEIVDEVSNMFKNGCTYIEPAMSYFVGIIYSFLIQKYYDISIFDALNDKDLLFSDRFFKLYKEKSEVYDRILKNIGSIFLYDSYIPFENIFKNEFLNQDNPILEGAWIFPDNSIKYLGNNYSHYRYLCFLYNDEEFKDDVYYNDCNSSFYKKYLNKGFIRVRCETNIIGLTYGNNSKYTDSIIKSIQYLIKNDNCFCLDNSPINYIMENVDTNEYESFVEYSDSLSLMYFDKRLKEKMK